MSGEVGGAGGAYSYNALKRLDKLWSDICSAQTGGLRSYHRFSPLLFTADSSECCAVNSLNIKKFFHVFCSCARAPANCFEYSWYI